MDDASIAALSHDARARERWVHDLCNAVHLLGVGTKVAQRLLDHGRLDDARAALAEGMTAWTRCRELLELAPEATALLAMPSPDAPRDTGTRRVD